MTEKKKIAIIGGGIAGLTFAHSLKSKDYEIHIFEKKEQFGEIGAAISVFPNALCIKPCSRKKWNNYRYIN